MRMLPLAEPCKVTLGEGGGNKKRERSDRTKLGEQENMVTV